MKKIIFILCNLLIISKLVTAQSVTLATTTNNPTAGTVVYNNGTNQLQYWNGTAWIPLTNAAAGTGWALSGSNIYKNNTGNVGIGTTTPSLPLTVHAGGKGFSQESLDGSAQIGFFTGSGAAYIQTHSNNDLLFATNNSLPSMVLQTGTGYLGIGASPPNPSNKLQIGSVGSTGFVGNDFVIGNGTNAMSISQNNFTTVLANTTDIVLRPRNNGTGYVGISADSPTNKLQIGAVTNAFVGNDLAIGNGTNTMSIYQSNASTKISSTTDIYLNPRNGGSGRVGINTETPRAPLDVVGSTPHSEYYYTYVVANTYTNGLKVCFDCTANVSIYAEQSIYAPEFDAFSDARIKNIIGVSNSAKDLETIKALQITDYTMKDKIKNGNKSYKKVIAQQVEKFYPQAVNQSTEVVPDIYALAQKVVFDKSKNELTCSLSKSYGIKIGDKIEFIHEKEGKIKAEVVAVSGNDFTVKDWEFPTDRLFVYGREVNDFRTVDYEAISMLGISAIQELAKKSEELEKKLEKQKSEFSNRLEKIEALLTKTNQ